MRFKNSNMLSKKYLWTFFMVVVVVDLLITMALFLLYSGVQVSKATDSSVAQLRQVCTSTDILHESLEAVVNQVRSDPDTVTFLTSSGTDRLQESKVGIKIRSIRIANPYLRYLTLYNGESNRFVSSAYAGYAENLDVPYLYEQLGDRGSVCFLRYVGSEYNVQKKKDLMVYTFVYKVNLTSDANTLVILDVLDTYFDNAIAPIRTEGQEQQIVMIDESGKTVSVASADKDSKKFSVKLNRTTPETLSDFTEGDYKITRDGAELKLVSHAHAAGTGWNIYNIMPFGAVLSGLGSVAALTLSLTAVTLLFGYFISKRASATLYTPIKELYENYVSGDSVERGDELERLSSAISELYSKADSLEQGLISSFEQSKNVYLMYLLRGEVKKVISALPTYERLNIDLQSPYYMVVLLECVQQSGDSSGQSDASLFISYYALENITRELLESARGVEFVRISERRFAALLNLDTPEMPDAIRSGLETVSATMSREFGIDTTICASNVTDSWENINLIFEQAFIAMNTRSTGHYGQIFLTDDKPQTLTNEMYYRGLQNILAEHVRKEDISACADEFDNALTSLSDVSFVSSKSYWKHILMSVMDEFSGYFERDGGSFTELMNELNEIDSCQNVRALKKIFVDFLDHLSRWLSAARKNGNQDVVMLVKGYIDKNFSDPKLSLRMLAEYVNLSPAYLGKIFTTSTTYSFNDYLNLVRTEKAAELLRNTKQPISQISEMVGILNSNYFYTVFKKNYGMTPAAYRKKESVTEG